MKIDSPRFGTLEIESERIIEFPRGLPGFDALQRFSLFHPEEGNAEPRYFILQSVDDPEVAFHLADPSYFGLDYEILLDDEDAAAIGLTDPNEAVVAVMLVRDESAEAPLRANLTAPLIINIRARRGLQHILARSPRSPEKEGAL